MKHNFTTKFAAFTLVAIAFILTVSSCDRFKGSEDTKYIPVQLTDGGAWIFIDEKGERVGAQQWEFQPTMTMGDLFTARTDSGLTVYRWSGKEAKPLDSLRNLASVGIYNEGLLPVAPFMQRIKVVDRKGNTRFTIEPIDGKEISSCSAQFNDGLLIVNTTEGKAGVIDKKGNVVVAPKYSEISPFNDGYALAMTVNYDDLETGPKYFILDTKGNETPVQGKFGFDEGECMTVSTFNHGIAVVAGEGSGEGENWTVNYKQINVDGQVTPLKGMESTEWLDNGSRIVMDYSRDEVACTWYDTKDKVIMKTEGYNNMIFSLEKFVAVNGENKVSIYNEEGKELTRMQGKGSLSASWPGGKFGVVIMDYGKENEPQYTILDAKGKALPQKYYGVGFYKMIYPDEVVGDIMCNTDLVTSAYVDVTAAANKLASMATGSVQGKEMYYIGQSVKDILAGENAKYYSGGSKEFSIPTGASGQLADGAGFWISGRAKSSANIVAPTYQNYFDVAYYDYWGRAWGYNRKRQVGVHFNSSATVSAFDLQLRTNHPSGSYLREALARKLRKDGYTQVNSADNYDEYSNGGNYVVVYGNLDSHGVGLLVGRKDVSNMTPIQKSELVSNL